LPVRMALANFSRRAFEAGWVPTGYEMTRSHWGLCLGLAFIVT